MSRLESRKLVKTRDPGIFKRGNKYVVVWRDARGTQHKTSAASLQQARKTKTEKDQLRQEGVMQASAHKMPFATYAREWIKTYNGRSNKGIREETREEYLADLELYAIPYFKKQTLGRITAADIEVFLNWLANDVPPIDKRKRAERGLAPASVRNAYAPVRAMFAQAVIRGHLHVNPCTGVIVPSAGPSGQVKAFTPEEQEAVLRNLPPKWNLFARFMLATGLRISEAVALDINSINWDTGELYVTDRIRNGKRGAPKSVHGTRTIPLSTKLLAELVDMRDNLSEQDDDSPLWQSLRGIRMNQENIYRRQFKPACVKAGVEWAGWHTMRHTAATRWLAAGIAPLVVSRLLGHATPAFTLATYAHVLPHDMPSGDELAGETTPPQPPAAPVLRIAV